MPGKETVGTITFESGTQKAIITLVDYKGGVYPITEFIPEINYFDGPNENQNIITNLTRMFLANFMVVNEKTERTKENDSTK